jgi:hypothetical protein
MTDLGLRLFLLLLSLALLLGMSGGVFALARIRELERAGEERAQR